jgi:uncharacterized protein (DUF1697 family)
MIDLRSAFEDAGYAGAATHIATGNVIVDRGRAPTRDHVEEVIEARFGFRSEAFIRSEEDLRSIVERDPWRGGDRLVEVSLLEGTPDRGAADVLEAGVSPPEGLVVSGAEVFFLREGKGIPTVHKESTTERLLGMRTTRRGMVTMSQIVERYLD